MQVNPRLKDITATRIRDQYMKRVDRALRSLPKKIREETALEIQSHLWDSMQDSTAQVEADRILDAIDRLGEPDDFIKPMVAGRLLEDASHSLNPKSVVMGLMYNAVAGVKKAGLSIVLGLGYLILCIFSLMSILKVILPHQVGLFFDPEGGAPFFGVLGDPGNHVEVLGFWIIPLGIVISFLLYFGLTRLLRIIFRESG